MHIISRGCSWSQSLTNAVLKLLNSPENRRQNLSWIQHFLLLQIEESKCMYYSNMFLKFKNILSVSLDVQ